MVALRTRATATLGSVAGDINNCRASRERDSAQIYDTLLNDFHCIYFWQLFFPFSLSFPHALRRDSSLPVCGSVQNSFHFHCRSVQHESSEHWANHDRHLQRTGHRSPLAKPPGQAENSRRQENSAIEMTNVLKIR